MVAGETQAVVLTSIEYFLDAPDRGLTKRAGRASVLGDEAGRLHDRAPAGDVGLTVAANSSGVWNVGSLPARARFSTICGDLTASPMAALSAPTMSGGVRAGTNTPSQASITTS